MNVILCFRTLVDRSLSREKTSGSEEALSIILIFLTHDLQTGNCQTTGLNINLV